MRTNQKILSSRRNATLSNRSALPRLKSLLLAQAARNAGRALDRIPGIAEHMRAASGKGDLKNLQDRLAVLFSSGSELSDMLLSGAIKLSRLETESGMGAVVRFNIVALLQDVAQATRTVIAQKPVTVVAVSSPDPVIILSDPCKIRLLMMELATNAATLTERGRIALILNRDEDRIRLMVTDTGRGMAVEDVSRFFEHVRGYHGKTTACAEFGLGFRIVKCLVASLNGTLSVSSRVGEGTIVEVSLPLPSDCGQLQ